MTTTPDTNHYSAAEARADSDSPFRATVTADQYASTLAMLADDMPDFVMIPAGQVVTVLSIESGLADIEFTHPLMVGPLGAYVSAAHIQPGA